jgi:hypothetical protein
MCFLSQVSEFRTYDEPLRRYALERSVIKSYGDVALSRGHVLQHDTGFLKAAIRRYFKCVNLGGAVFLTCYILPLQAALQGCFNAISTWQDRRNILFEMGEGCGNATAHPR